MGTGDVLVLQFWFSKSSILDVRQGSESACQVNCLELNVHLMQIWKSAIIFVFVRKYYV